MIAPLGLPAEVGAKTALKEAFWPALITCPADNPLMLYPVPEALAAEIVTLAVPVLLSVIGMVALVLIRILPKPTLAGLGESAPCAPVPLRAIVAGDPGALLLIEMTPDGVPLTVGANFAVKVSFWPAAITCPADSPLAL